MTSNEMKTIADTIRQQLGGKMFAVMTGAKDFVYGDDDGRVFLRFRLPGTPGFVKNKARWVKIYLDASDTYTMEFIGAPRFGTEPFVITREEGLYFDQLQTTFETATGLYTRLPAAARQSA